MHADGILGRWYAEADGTTASRMVTHLDLGRRHCNRRRLGGAGAAQ